MERKPVYDSCHDFHTAVQYLTWALEEIDKFGNPKAAGHARIALEELRTVHLARLEAAAGRDGRGVARGNTGHRRKIADVAVDHAEERTDGGLVGGDAVEVTAHTAT
jgi:hypothetical protein